MPDLRFWRWRMAEDDDLAREIETHLELATDEHLEEGLPLRDARLAAHRQFGSVALTKEELGDMRTGAAIENHACARCFAHDPSRKPVPTPAFARVGFFGIILSHACVVRS